MLLAKAPPPRFDIVSVEPSGAAVIAGRALPDGKVALMSGGEVLAEGSADSAGLFVLQLHPLVPGDYTLKLRMRPRAGDSASSVETAEVEPGGGPPLSQRCSDFRGCNGRRWPVVIEARQDPSARPLRLARRQDRSNQRGGRLVRGNSVRVLRRRAADAAWSRTLRDADAAAGQAETAVVQRGGGHWRISQKILGKGLHYTEIYAANSAQIPDPHKIYPGQVFVMPKDHGP